MGKVEIQQIVNTLTDVYEAIRERDDDVSLHIHLSELYRIIQRLMVATSGTGDQGLKVLLAHLEYRARQYKGEIEEWLGVRN